MKLVCEALNCEKQVQSRNLCMTHYQRFRRYGNAETKNKRECSPAAINQKFNMLTIVKELDAKVTVDGTKIRMVLCMCDCGKSKEISYFPVIRGKTRSCGCLMRKNKPKPIKIPKVSKAFGLARSGIYAAHHSMKQRCANKNNPGYKDYGGRGITYCEKWESFVGFSEDMLESYLPGLTIERIDVNGNYCKENCKWIPMNMQGLNKRNSIQITHNGVTRCLSEWAREYGIDKGTMGLRYKKGWSFEMMVSKEKINRYR